LQQRFCAGNCIDKQSTAGANARQIKIVATDILSVRGFIGTGPLAHRGSFSRCPSRPLLLCCSLRQLAVQARFCGGLGPQHGRIRLSGHAQRGASRRPQALDVFLRAMTRHHKQKRLPMHQDKRRVTWLTITKVTRATNSEGYMMPDGRKYQLAVMINPATFSSLIFGAALCDSRFSFKLGINLALRNDSLLL